MSDSLQVSHSQSAMAAYKSAAPGSALGGYAPTTSLEGELLPWKCRSLVVIAQVVQPHVIFRRIDQFAESSRLLLPGHFQDFKDRG